MGGMGEIFNEITEQKKKRARKRKLSSSEILEGRSLVVKICNNGEHLIIEGLEGLIDFWPSTGRFITRDKKVSDWGVHKLLTLCPMEGNIANPLDT